ncbi:MAG: hypothetical protein PV362_04390 [Providencia heimbachae]|nr:hypothetical protein [Providencia heimbachae]
MEQSEERKEYIRRLPLAKQCEEQMQHGDYQLPACQNMTAQANFMDLYTLSADFQNISPQAKNVTYKIYNAIRQWTNLYLSENIIDVQNKENKVELLARFGLDYSALNATLRTPHMMAQWTNMRVHPWFRPIVSMHPTMSVIERLGQKVLRGQYARKYCLHINSKFYQFHLYVILFDNYSNLHCW